MTRQTLPSEFNSFVGGLITEASPLTFPGNAALDINNFNLDKNGTISRRLGMDYENEYTIVDSGVSTSESAEAAISTYTWVNAGGDSRTSVVVIQTGNVLKFFDTSGFTITASLIHTHTFPEGIDVKLSMAVVDGILVVVGAGKEPSAFVYEGGVISDTSYQLKVRDVFGVEDIIDGVDLRSPTNITVRPLLTSQTSEHVYNLRNSTYAQPRINQDNDFISDPISIFRASAGSTIPSNSDSVTSALFANPEISSDRFTERFYPKTLIKSPVGNFESPIGYFVIDALERGTSRLQESAELYSQLDLPVYNDHPITSLPLDRTPGGATAVGEYAGRVWYSGFSGEIIGGDSYSPRMSSYILFSKLVTSASDLSTCHQIGDPTSKESPDLLDTDGGFIRLDEAYGISKLVNIGSGLVVVAENGIWAVTGGSDYGFTATQYKTSKITNHGCTNSDSVVLVDNSVMYWGDDGIYQVSPSELGDLRATNITSATIQSVYEGVSNLDKASVQGHFDTYDRKVRWVYQNRLSTVGDVKELVLDIALGAFYLHTIPNTSSTSPKVVAPVEVPPFRVGEVTGGVTDLTIGVTDSAIPLTDTVEVPIGGIRELMYLTTTSTTPTVKYTLSKYRDLNFVDWLSHDAVGVDSPAYLITGYNGGGDYQRNKQVPYATFHLEKTEEGFSTDELGDIYPTHESSCKVQAQWEWANSPASGRWGREFQAYRHKRSYMPEDTNDSYDNGFSVVTTKNKIRGKGRVLSLQITTEPLKDCKLLGWSIITSVANNV